MEYLQGQILFEEKSVKVNEMEEIKEKLERYGIDTLNNKELLNLLSTKKNKKEVEKLLEQEVDIIDFFHNNSIDFLKELFGKNAIIIKSVLELNKRRNDRRVVKICSPKDAANYLMEELRFLKQEHLVVLYLNTKGIIIKKEVVFIGSLNSSVVHPREIFKKALENSCASMIIAHNHPSGDPTPSNEDIALTRRIQESGKILGINLLDHIIIGDGQYISLKDKGFF